MGLVDADGKPFREDVTAAAWPMFVREMEKVWENNLSFDRMRRIAELRESCGVKSPESTVMVRRPPRYQGL